METIADESKSYMDLGKIIEHDQSLAERVVAMANSPYFGHSGMINNIDQAVLILGFDLVKSIAISMSVFELFSKTEAKKMKKLWVHSYKVAIASSELCGKIPVTTAGVCFLGGLLHDIGRLVFFSLYPDRYRDFMFEEGLSEKERRIFGTDHAEVAGWFLEGMLIPEEIITAVKCHHDIKACSKHVGVASTVYFAEGIISSMDKDEASDGKWVDEMESLFLECGLSGDDIVMIEKRINEEAEEIRRFFDL